MIIFREAVASDWLQIKNLIKQFKTSLKQNNLPSFKSFFVAESAGKIVGCCAAAVMVLEDPAQQDETPKELEIRSLAVLPEFQKQGIGSQLIGLCEQRRKDLGIKQGLTFASEASKSIFEKLDYTTYTEWKHAMFKEDK